MSKVYKVFRSVQNQIQSGIENGQIVDSVIQSTDFTREQAKNFIKSVNNFESQINNPATCREQLSKTLLLSGFTTEQASEIADATFDIIELVEIIRKNRIATIYSMLFTIVGILVLIGLFHAFWDGGNIVKLSWISFGVFIATFALSGYIMDLNGKFALLNAILTYIATLFATILTTLLFLADDWGDAPATHISGRRAGIFKLLIEIFYSIGSAGFFYIMAIVSLFLLWATKNTLQNYMVGNKPMYER